MLARTKVERTSRNTEDHREEKYREVMTKEFAPAGTMRQQEHMAEGIATAQPTQEDKLDAISSMMELPSDRIRPAAWAAAKLYADAKERFDDPQVFTMTMHVKVDGKVELIPVPQRENIEKLREHFDKLPKQLQRTLKKSIPKDHWDALRELCNYLDTCSSSKKDMDTKSS